MPTLFCNPGKIVTLSDPGCGLPIQISLECWQPGSVFRAVITQIGINQQGGFQFMHTLRDKIFLYIFGERIGEMTISGVTFTGGCEGFGNNYAGIESVLGYYQACRATRRHAPLQVAIGRIAFKAFLLGVRTDIADPETGLGHFSFRLFFPPTSTTAGNLAIACPDPGDTSGQSQSQSEGFCLSPSCG